MPRRPESVYVKCVISGATPTDFTGPMQIGRANKGGSTWRAGVRLPRPAAVRSGAKKPMARNSAKKRVIKAARVGRARSTVGKVAYDWYRLNNAGTLSRIRLMGTLPAGKVAAWNWLKANYSEYFN